MHWNEVAPVAQNLLPMAAMREHLRLGTGFADDGAQDSLIERLLRAAIRLVEGQTSKSLILRDFRLVSESWRGCDLLLPTAPASSVVSVELKDSTGAVTALAPSAFRVVNDGPAAVIRAVGGSGPTVPVGGSVEIVFRAGFGPSWSDCPPDLAQAVMLVAAHLHENRHAIGEPATSLPYGVAALIAPWRPMRIGGGARS